MLNKLFLFLLSPFNVWTPLESSAPDQLGLEVISTSTDQLAVQPPNNPTIEDAAPWTSPQPSCMVKQLYQFESNLTRLENLAVRPNGQLVLNVVTKPIIYGYNPSKPNSDSNPKKLHTFTNVTSVLGIDEITPDVFAVVVGNFSDVGHHEPGTFSIWSVDLKKSKPNVTLITAIPEAQALNGLSTINGTEPMILIADSVDGVLWRVVPRTKEYIKIFDSPLLSNTTVKNIGVNGIRTFQQKLYFINSGQATYGRVPLHQNATAAGEVEILARVQGIGKWDDLDIDWEGNAWVATHRGDLTEITLEGRQRTTKACEGVKMLDPTSARFGRGSKKEQKTLYVVTAGNSDGPGQVVAADTCQM